MSGPNAALDAWGWDAGWALAFESMAAAGATPGRVLTTSGTTFTVGSAAGDVTAVAGPALRRSATDARDLPAVGDWVALDHASAPSEVDAAIVAVLERRTAFVRHAPGRRADPQVIAANVDTVLIVMALTRDLNLRRLERYLGATWSSGARPVVLLSKADLCADVDAARTRVESVALGLPVLVVSAMSHQGLVELGDHLMTGTTVALLGSSGVGKSTLINTLLGEARQAVRATRADDERGRHTTSVRELIRLPGGAIVLDTPGLRSLALWDDEGVDRAFADIEELAATCRFSDCRHEREPGCAVLAAIDDGSLAPVRLESRRKLERELRALERRTSPGASRAAARRWGKLTRNAGSDALARKRGWTPAEDGW